MVRVSQADDLTRADEVILFYFLCLFLAVLGPHCRAACIYCSNWRLSSSAVWPYLVAALVEHGR